MVRVTQSGSCGMSNTVAFTTSPSASRLAPSSILNPMKVLLPTLLLVLRVMFAVPKYASTDIVDIWSSMFPVTVKLVGRKSAFNPMVVPAGGKNWVRTGWKASAQTPFVGSCPNAGISCVAQRNKRTAIHEAMSLSRSCREQPHPSLQEGKKEFYVSHALLPSHTGNLFGRCAEREKGELNYSLLLFRCGLPVWRQRLRPFLFQSYKREKVSC